MKRERNLQQWKVAIQALSPAMNRLACRNPQHVILVKLCQLLRMFVEICTTDSRIDGTGAYREQKAMTSTVS